MIAGNPIYDGRALDAPVDFPALVLLLIVPLLGAVLAGLVGPLCRFSRRVTAMVAVSAMVAATVLAVVLVAAALAALPPGQRSLHQALWPLFTVAGVEVTLGLTLDALSAVMVLVVTVVGTLIHVYAAGYMKDEPSSPRFFGLLNLFVCSMLLLVLADGFVPLLFGWEGVGVCSYLLIGFWFRRPAAADAATKAFLVNRVADWGLVVGVCALLWGLGASWQPQTLAPEAPHTVLARAPSGAPIELQGLAEWPSNATVRDVRIGPTLGFRELEAQLRLEYGSAGEDGHGNRRHGRPFAEALARKRLGGVPLVFVVSLLLFLGAAGKSAQVPFFAWLPDAMVGPTPVSALIHAATMVTAGVYLIARLGFLFALSPAALAVIAAAGALTAFIGATAGCLQWDLKRVLAYSTVSQLGFMFAAVGMGAFSDGVFHLTTHAFFKACLFLAAGSVIHAVNHIESGESSDPQDMRNMGGLARALPWTRRGYLVACVAIAGFPVASGFFSKDRILAGVLEGGGPPALRATVVAVLGATSALTAFYMFRSYFLIFWARPPRVEPPGARHRPSRRMRWSMISLAVGSILVGPLIGWPSSWSSSHALPFIHRILRPVFLPELGGGPAVAAGEVAPAVEWALQLGSVALAAIGLLAARAYYRDSGATFESRRRLAEGSRRLVSFVGAGWRFDDLYRELVLGPVRDFSRAAVWVDARLLDPAVDGVAVIGRGLARVAGALDRRLFDGALAGVSQLVLAAGRVSVRLQSGRIGAYVLGIAAGVAGLALLAYLLGR